MAIWGTAIAAAASVVGGVMSSKASKKAAKGAKFKPANVFGPGGNARFNRNAAGTYDLLLEPNDVDRNIRQGFTDRALQGVQGSQYGQLAGQLQESSGGSLNDLFGEYQDMETFGGLSGLQTASDLSGLGDLSTEQAMQAFSRLGQGPSGMGMINDMAGRAGSLLDMSGTPSFNQLAGQRLSALREQARPQEERLVNSKFSDLFSAGRLGTTGGSQILGDLSQALNQEDLSRIINSQDFAQGQSNIEQQFALGRGQLGAGLFGTALQGVGQEQSNAMNFGNMGAGLLDQAMRARAGTNEAFLSSDNSRLSRGQTRLSAAQQMFGFGDTLQGTELDRALALLGGAQTIDQNLLEQAKVGGSIGQAQSSAGANAAALRGGSNLGSALQGFGAGVLNGGGTGGSSLSSLFARNNQASPAPMGQSGATGYVNPGLWNGRK